MLKIGMCAGLIGISLLSSGAVQVDAKEQQNKTVDHSTNRKFAQLEKNSMHG